MTSDPIVDEIKRYREQVAAKLNHDLRAIVADARRRQKLDGRIVIRREPRRPHVQSAKSDSAS